MEKEGTQGHEGDGHPIPIETLETIDVLVENKDENGIKLIIIAAGYLDNSDYTVKRIADKINNYLAIINHQEFIEDFGLPSPDRTIIELVCNVEPHPEIYELIERLKEPVHSYNASIFLIIKK